MLSDECEPVSECDVSVSIIPHKDSDRLDLGRAGTTPKAEFLCTDAAKDPVVIERVHIWAIKIKGEARYSTSALSIMRQSI